MSTNADIKLYSTWRDVKGRIWVLVKLYYPELDDPTPSGITLYRVNSDDERQHLTIVDFNMYVNQGLFKRIIN